jgi:hypothetical protein
MAEFIEAKDLPCSTLPEGCAGYYPGLPSPRASAISWEEIFLRLREEAGLRPIPQSAAAYAPHEDSLQKTNSNCMSFVLGLTDYGQADCAIKNAEDAKSFLDLSGVLDPYFLEINSLSASVYFWPITVDEKGVQQNRDFHWAIQCSSGKIAEKQGCLGDFYLWNNFEVLETHVKERKDVFGRRLYSFHVEAKLKVSLH